MILIVGSRKPCHDELIIKEDKVLEKLHIKNSLITINKFQIKRDLNPKYIRRV